MTICPVLKKLLPLIVLPLFGDRTSTPTGASLIVLPVILFWKWRAPGHERIAPRRAASNFGADEIEISCGFVCERVGK